jgi:aspartyl protease family protein
MRGLLFASAVIVLVAVSAPSLFSRYLDGGGSGVRTPSREAFARERNDDGDLSSRESSSYATSRQVMVEAERDGHFYVDAKINFRPVRLIVDTGASVGALRESDAATVGIRPRPGDYVHPVQTANGTTSAAEATLDSVSVDDIEVRNVRALVLPDDQLAISLLGASFLNGLERFEVTDGTLSMEN